MNDKSQGSNVSIYEVVIFLGLNFIYLLVGFIGWYFLWVRRHGIEIPTLIGKTISYFSSRNVSLVLSEILSRLFSLNIESITGTIGYEAYSFLCFQRILIWTIFQLWLLSVFVWFCRFYAAYFFLTDKAEQQFLHVINIVSISLITFIHFKSFADLKRETYSQYTSRFLKLSRKKDYKWLSCRTLHIAGIQPEERHTSLLQSKLNFFLSKTNSGHVVDINFIPNYNRLLAYEKERNEINDLKLLITYEKPCFRCCFSSTFWSEASMQSELKKVQAKIDEITEEPVFSSGHAFVCFNSLDAADKVMKEFQTSVWKRMKMWLKNLCMDVKKATKKREGEELVSGRKAKSTFLKFNEENEIGNLDDNQIVDILDDSEGSVSVNILADQIIEPIDIIWENIGSERGLFLIRRIFLNLLMLVIIVFFTTPMSFITTLKKFDTYQVLEFGWLINIPFGYILRTYIVPLMIIGINLGLIVTIDFICRFEKYYTHSNYHFSFFVKSFFYMLFNFLIIPSLTLSYEPLYEIIMYNYKNILQLLSGITSIFDNSYFFVNLIVQNGTVSFVFYFLRLSDLIPNALSTQVAFYKRHFINTGHPWHRNEEDCFYYGYFSAQYMVFYAICLAFSNSHPVVLLAGLYYFCIRHFGDFTNLLTVHLLEIDSNGKHVNHLINYAFIPLGIFHFFMFFEAISHEFYVEALIIALIFILSILFYVLKYNSDYVRDIYAEYSNKITEKGGINEKQPISKNELNKWTNKFKHPLVIPVFTEESKSSSKENVMIN